VRLRRRDGFVEATLESAGRAVDDGGHEWSLGGDDPEGAPGTRVLLAPVGDASSARAELVDVLDRPEAGWVGILQRERGGGRVTPYRDDSRWTVRVAPKDCGDARSGDVVVVAPAAASPPRNRPKGASRARSQAGEPRGCVVETLGPPGTAEADFRAVVWRHRLPVVFSDAVERESDALPAELSRRELSRRLDLRDRVFVTIDPASARDHDDAVLCEPIESGGTRLWVAIADVAHAVVPGGAIDREALRRSNSVYFPDRSIPMLPERISGDLCSLRAEVDRLVVVVEMRVAVDGRIRRPRFHRAVIRSRVGLDYARAARAMQGGDGLTEVPEGGAVCASLTALAETAERLRKRRLDAGAVELDLPEVVIRMDDDGRPMEIDHAERTVAHHAIEEAMLAANRSVSRKLSRGETPSVFRVHEEPAPADWTALRERLEKAGLLERRGRQPLSPAALAAALRRAEGTPQQPWIHLFVLRAMRQARYHREDCGHFALAFDSYAHFTSPIRRYADLVTHRALLSTMGEEPPPDPERLDAVAMRLSYRERVAMDAEREMAAIKKCVFMRGRVGEVFDGRISGIARHGAYVTLDDPPIEGLIPTQTLGAGVVFDEQAHELRGGRSGRRYTLGQEVRVRLVEVDPVRTWITLSLIGQEGRGSGASSRAAAGSSRAASSSARRSQSR
jgi:ribonuclease R